MPIERVGAPKGRSRLVAEELLSFIRSSQYSAGQRLPPEREIARLTGTSRSCVREALSSLQIIGIVETRPGEGTFVRLDGQNVPALDKAAQDLELALEAIQLWEARESLEVELLKTSDMGNVASSRKPLGDCIDGMRDALEKGDYCLFNACHRDFHAELASISGRPELVRAVAVLTKLTEKYVSALLLRLPEEAKSAHFADSLRDHVTILEFISRGDIDGAAESLALHFAAFPRYLRNTFFLGALVAAVGPQACMDDNPRQGPNGEAGHPRGTGSCAAQGSVTRCASGSQDRPDAVGSVKIRSATREPSLGSVKSLGKPQGGYNGGSESNPALQGVHRDSAP